MLCPSLARWSTLSVGRYTSVAQHSTSQRTFLKLQTRSFAVSTGFVPRQSAHLQHFSSDQRPVHRPALSARKGSINTRTAAIASPYSTMTQEVHPATLPGTPKNFPIGEQELISKAKQIFDTASGQKDPSVLSDDFRFEFPIISLGKEEYLKATGTFNLDEAFPNLASHPYHWRVDPYEPNRVWFTTRVTATHSGPLKFFNKSFKATNKQVLGAPECLSYTFNEQGKVTSFTGGYIMDRRVGNTKKMGALFGILAAIGGPIPEPETIPYAFFILSNRLSSIFQSILGRLTFGVIGTKPKKA